MSEGAVDRWIRRQSWLDSLGAFLQKVIGGVYGLLGAPGQLLKNLLHGTSLPTHHPLHPAITDLVIGAWAVAFAADLLGFHDVAAFAIWVGLVMASGALASGYTDFHSTYAQERRVATLHGLLMTVISVAYLVSLQMRTDLAWQEPGYALSAVAFVVLIAGGWLGGHLAFVIGTGVNHNAFTEAPSKFVEVGGSGDFQEGELAVAEAKGAKVLLLRYKGRLYAMSDTCSHAGGPLHEGKLTGCEVTCPWHESRFCVKDGRALSGPSAYPQPTYLVREDAGRVSVKLEI